MKKSKWLKMFFGAGFIIFILHLVLTAFVPNYWMVWKETCNLVIFIICALLCITGLICYTIVYVNDDQEIRLIKLEKLIEAKNEFSGQDKNSMQKEEKQYVSCKAQTIKKSIYLDLMKTYMTMITEI
ncbi:MAG: hypothetical protein J6Y36_05465 [Treponema sp.]|nr:hypothetical protein [Treponema sp.]